MINYSKYIYDSTNETNRSVDILSSLVEVYTGDAHKMRAVAYVLDSYGLVDLAISLYKNIYAIRAEEPQSLRDYALALIKRATPEDLQQALTLLCNIVTNAWDIRFTQIELVALFELNHLVRKMGYSVHKNEVYREMISKYNIPLDMPLEVDLRIVLVWDTDDCDLELRVKQPNNEVCYSFNNQTSIGGLMSKDMTGGYGPEEFIVLNVTYL